MVKCGFVVWHIQFSGCENVDTWFSTFTVCDSNRAVCDADFCNAEGGWVEHDIEDHEVSYSNDV